MRLFNTIALLLASSAISPASSQFTEVPGEDVGLDAWHMDYLYTLVTEQLDPIVSPNRQSSHMHRVLGGSNFAAAYNFDELRASPCTSASISIDHSSYWSPQLYWIVDPANPSTTSFMQLPSYNRFYYFLGRNDPTVPVIPFPKGFRMLAGDPNRKSANPIFVYECHRNPDLTGSLTGPSFNFNDPCKYGIKFDLTFPSCWDGVNLYKTDNSHTAYPLKSIRDGGCPATHPKRIPSILLEYTYHPEAFPAVTKGQNVNGHLAWANGDTTSYGLHADFLNGWDVDILNKALNDPGCVNIGKSIQIEKCPVLAPYFNIAAGKACKPSRGQLTEPFPQGDGNVVPKLPGCNLLWGATGPKPTCNPSPAALDVSAFLSTDGPYVVPTSQQYNSSLTLNQSKGWHSVACFSNTGNDRPLGSNTLSYYDSNMTPTRCQSSCARNGYTYAGLQVVGGFSCICSDTLNNQSAIAYSGCSTPCPSSTATCGGQYLTDVYYQAAAFVGRDPSAYDLGCYALPTNATSSGLIPASTYSFPSTSMTRDVCSQACVSKGAKWSAIRDSTCYCGTNFNMGTGYFVPNDFCSLTCKGNASETCGNYYAMNTFNLTNYAYKAPATGSTGAGGYRGCFAQGSGKALSAYSFADSKLTPEMCKSYCNQLGYSLAGAMNGNQCSCDNTFQGGQMLPDSQCGTPCAGNSSSTCGAQYNIQLYNSSAAIYGAAQATAAHPAGWQGCYAASLISSKTAYSNYTIYPDTLSVSSCKTTCAYFGYPYMALWGNSCNCGAQLVKTNRYADAFCNAKCKSSSETCGGSQYTDVYSVSATQAPDTSALRARGWVGCYNNPASGAALSSYSYAGSTMTPQICQAACLKNGGWKFSGVNRNLCTCGNVNMGIAQPPSSCNLACSGDANQICGGPFSYSIYTSAANSSATSSTVTASRTTTSSTASVKTSSAATSATTTGASDPFATYVYRGCIADGSSRAMNATSTYSGSMTVARCAAEAKSGGFKFFGMESGGQCFVTNKLAYVTPTTGCDVACPGDATKQTMCGGSWKISYYEYVPSSGVSASTTSAPTSAATSKPTTTTASTTLAASSSSTVKTSTAAAPAASSSYTARGCVADGATRALNGSSTSATDMTIAKCATFAQAAKARFFGLENGNQCFTGTVLAYNTTSTNCKTVCAGDASKSTVCGGGYALSLYEFAPAVVAQYAAPNLAAVRRSLHWSKQAQHRPPGRRARQLV